MNKKKEPKKLPIKLFLLFIVVELAMFLMSVFFAGGGHGTGIPIIIFYGPLLIFFKFGIFENNPALSFLVLFLIMFGLFFSTCLNFISKKVLSYIASFYVLVSLGMLIYIELNNLGLGSDTISTNVKLISAVIACVVSALFWKIIFDSVGSVKEPVANPTS